MTLGDLDSSAAVHRLLQIFFAHLLDEPALKGLFEDVDGAHLASKINLIQQRWCDLLLNQAPCSPAIPDVDDWRAARHLSTLPELEWRLAESLLQQVIELHFHGDVAHKARQHLRLLLLAMLNCS